MELTSVVSHGQESTACSSAINPIVTHTHTRLTALFRDYPGELSGYQKGKTSLDFTEARDSEWQWHQLGYMQVCTSLQTDNHTSTPTFSFFKGRMTFLCLTNSIKALKAH